MELIRVGEAAGVRLEAVNHSRIVIGRSVACDVVIADPGVSRRHAMLESVSGRWRIRDLASRNGLHVNGTRVSRSTPVQAGDRIQIGSTVLRLAEQDSGVDPELATGRVVETAGPGRLSSREREVLAQLASGRTDEQIADALTISVTTVRSHLDRIRDKTGARRRPDLTRHAAELGLLPDLPHIPKAS